MTSSRSSVAVGWLALSLFAASAVVAGCGHGAEVRADSGAPKVVQADVLTVGPEATPGAYVATGTVKAQLNASLSSKVTGRVESISVRVGDKVKAGQLLVTIDSGELRAAADVAKANYQASIVGVDSAQTAAEMESRTSQARIAQAESQVQQARAALAAAEARRDLVVAGPRTQEVEQTRIAVVQAQSSLKLAMLDLDRTATLVRDGALAKRDLDLAQNRYDVAKGQYEAAVQSQNIAREGARAQEIQAAKDSVTQAQGALKQALSAVAEARAGALQVQVRQKEVEVAGAQVRQSSAAQHAADVGLSYSRILAPFDGRVVARSVDPGAMAGVGVPLLTVEGGEYRLEAAVPEDVLKSIVVGQTAQVAVDAAPDTKLSGRVVEVNPQGDPSTHNFTVKYALKAAPGLKAGMFGRVQIRTGTVSRILIPETATWEREGLHYVFALNAEGIARLRIVTLGRRFGDRIEALSGLAARDRIVVGNRQAVADGTKVEAK